MIEINTFSGNTYYYSDFTNRLYTSSLAETKDECVVCSFESDNTYVKQEISSYTIEITQQCNLRCRYCIYSGEYKGHRTHNAVSMSFESIKKAIDLIGQTCDRSLPSISVCFYGGEALLEREKIVFFIEMLNKHYPEISFEYYISSNGVLLTPPIIEWISKTPKLNVVITIDGDQKTHDLNRVTAKNNGTFETIMNNLSFFKAQYPNEYNERVSYISTVKSILDIIPLNNFWMSNPILKEKRPQHIASLITNFSKGESVSNQSDPFLKFYRAALNEYKSGNNNILTDELFKFINVVERRHLFLLQEKQIVHTCLNNPYSCFVSATGELSICEKLNSGFPIGNLNEGINTDSCKMLNNYFIKRKNAICKDCWAKRMCRICPKSLNNNIKELEQYCECERIQLKLALQLFCEILEYKKNTNNGSV